MGQAKFILGFEIVINSLKKLLSMCKEAYVKNILERLWMHNSKLMDTPLEKSLSQCPKIDNGKEKRSNVPYTQVTSNL